MKHQGLFSLKGSIQTRNLDEVEIAEAPETIALAISGLRIASLHNLGLLNFLECDGMCLFTQS